MPPKPKFTREEVVEVALKLVSEKGMESLTARELGERLGSSARPIFTAFRNMEELTDEVRAAAMRKYDTYVGTAVNYTPAFKRFGMQMVLFAIEEPNLFRLLFMRDNQERANFSTVEELLGPTRLLCIGAIAGDYGMTEQEAAAFFEHMWVFTYGLAVLCATGMCKFSEEEICIILGRQFMGSLGLMKSGGWDAPTPRPEMQISKKILEKDQTQPAVDTFPR